MSIGSLIRLDVTMKRPRGLLTAAVVHTIDTAAAPPALADAFVVAHSELIEAPA